MNPILLETLVGLIFPHLIGVCEKVDSDLGFGGGFWVCDKVASDLGLGGSFRWQLWFPQIVTTDKS